MNYQHISQQGQCTKVVKLKMKYGLCNILITKHGYQPHWVEIVHHESIAVSFKEFDV